MSYPRFDVANAIEDFSETVCIYFEALRRKGPYLIFSGLCDGSGSGSSPAS